MSEKDNDIGNIVGRFGGEEFAILLPETNLDQALFVAERIRSSVERMLFKVPSANGGNDLELLHMTVSIGVSALKPEVDSMLDLLNLADQALYKAKEAGRNRVCINTNQRTNFLPNHPKTATYLNKRSWVF